MSKLPKIFVLDTNIILHDSKAIYHFQENDLVIPIAVIEELDKFKKGDEEINYHAREFVRMIFTGKSNTYIFGIKINLLRPISPGIFTSQTYTDIFITKIKVLYEKILLSIFNPHCHDRFSMR